MMTVSKFHEILGKYVKFAPDAELFMVVAIEGHRVNAPVMGLQPMQRGDGLKMLWLIGPDVEKLAFTGMTFLEVD